MNRKIVQKEIVQKKRVQKRKVQKKRVILQAALGGKAMTFTMDKLTEENIKTAQELAESLLNLKCSAAVIIRRALHYYVNRTMVDGIDIMLEGGDFTKIGEYLEKERETFFAVAGRDDDGRH